MLPVTGEALPKKKKADRYFDTAEAAAEDPAIPAGGEKPKVCQLICIHWA